MRGETLLKGTTRRVLAWATALTTAVVIASGMALIIDSAMGPGRRARALAVIPPEPVLCPGQAVVFALDPPLEDVQWAATGGGEISADGHYVAGATPGDYEVQVAGPSGERG
ncbi:MAG TPA: hypothetical protein EYH30_03610 [Anaerolineales bacterium]|nr:hypothetical protein [Anaerolineales bacterium]